MKYYLGYCRVSNKDHENSIPAQKKILEDFAERKGVKLIKIYTEKKSAFGKSNRKIFTEMINHLGQEEVAGVIFHKVDRSARNMKDFALLEKFFDSKDVRVIEGEFDTNSAQGRFQFRIFCSMAVWYSENLSEEVSIKMEGCLRRGYYPSVAPIGYKSLGNGKKVPDKYFSLVREAFLLYDKGEYSAQGLAKVMNAKGLRNKAGNKMAINPILTMLKNPFYYGYMKFGKYPLYKGNHEPCISKALYDRVQNRIEGRVIRTPGIYHNYAYNRLIRYEGKVFLIGARRRKKVYYEVSRYDRDKVYFRIDDKVKKYISEEVLDERFQDLFAQLRFRKGFFKEFKKAIDTEEKKGMKTAESTKQDQLSIIDKEIGKAQARLKNLKKRLLDGVFSEKEYEEMKDELDNDIHELMEQRKNIESAFDYEDLKNDGEFWGAVRNFINLPKLIADKFYLIDPDTKRSLLELFFETLEVRAGLLKVKFVQATEAFLETLNFGALEHPNFNPPKGLTGFPTDFLQSGRGERTRTFDPMVPNHVL